jgi:predicted acylesterase/phospholipase RssA
MKRYQTLVLSGDSTNAVALLGALQRMYEKGVLAHIRTYVATSSGTIISVMLSLGYSPLDIVNYLCVERVYDTMPHFNMANILVSGKSVLDFTPIKTCVEGMVVEKLGFVPTLRELATHTKGVCIAFTVFNLNDFRKEYLTADTHPDLKVSDAVHMSCNFPLIFSPYPYGNTFYIDGGVADNFPAEHAVNTYPGPVLGVCIENPAPKYTPRETPLASLDMVRILYAIHLFVTLQDKRNRVSDRCDVVTIRQELNFFNFNSKNSDLLALFDAGYDKSKEWF